MPMANGRGSLDYVPITGRGVDALERRKEHNNNEKVTASILQAKIEKVKDGIFAGLRSLIAEAYKRARTS